MKKVLAILISIGCLSISYAQQDPLYNQYFFNQLMINPAYAGSAGNLTASLNTRQQWAGIDGAPLTNTLSVHSSFSRNKSGAGLLIVDDRLGINKNMEIMLSLSHRIKIGSHTISMGVQGGTTQYKYDYTRINLEVLDDPDLMMNLEQFSKPNFGTGIFWSSEWHYVGISVPRILNIKVNDGVTSSTRYLRHYYISGGFVLNPKYKNEIKIKPSVLIKMVNGNPVSVDLSGSILLSNMLWTGITIRNFTSLGINAQMEITDNLRIGYAFELPTSNLVYSNFGTHELMVSVGLAVLRGQEYRVRYF